MNNVKISNQKQTKSSKMVFEWNRSEANTFDKAKSFISKQSKHAYIKKLKY
jgi:hypothetical protein